MKRLKEKVEAKRKRTLAGGSKKVKKKMAEEKYQMPDEVVKMAMKMNPVDESKSLERLNAVVVDQMVRMKGMKMKVHEDDVGNGDDNAGARRESGNAVAVANDDDVVVVDDEEGMMMMKL